MNVRIVDGGGGRRSDGDGGGGVVLLLLLLLLPPSSCLSCFRAVMRVFTTQMGFVSSTVALPARAPATTYSIVVSFCAVRPAFRAAFSKAARVHSYPKNKQFFWK
jgi:hypothetical protein